MHEVDHINPQASGGKAPINKHNATAPIVKGTLHNVNKTCLLSGVKSRKRNPRGLVVPETGIRYVIHPRS